MAEHNLKVWPEYWDALVSGEKTFEVRRDDRGFQVGDTLVLRKTALPRPLFEGSKALGSPFTTGEEIRKRVLWILTGGQFGIEPGYVVMAIGPAETNPGSEK